MSRRGRPSKPRDDDTVVTAVRLPKSLIKRLKHRAIDEDRAAAEIIADAIRQHLER